MAITPEMQSALEEARALQIELMPDEATNSRTGITTPIRVFPMKTGQMLKDLPRFAHLERYKLTQPWLGHSSWAGTGLELGDQLTVVGNATGIYTPTRVEERASFDAQCISWGVIGANAYFRNATVTFRAAEDSENQYWTGRVQILEYEQDKLIIYNQAPKYDWTVIYDPALVHYPNGSEPDQGHTLEWSERFGHNDDGTIRGEPISRPMPSYGFRTLRCVYVKESA